MFKWVENLLDLFGIKRFKIGDRFCIIADDSPENFRLIGRMRDDGELYWLAEITNLKRLGGEEKCHYKKAIYGHSSETGFPIVKISDQFLRDYCVKIDPLGIYADEKD